MAGCSYLGFKQDPVTSTAFPSTANYCHRVTPCNAVRLHHQEAYCLTDKHQECPVLLADAPTQLPRDIRIASGRKRRRAPRRWTALLVVLLVMASAALVAAWQNRAALMRAMAPAEPSRAIPAAGPGAMATPDWTHFTEQSPPTETASPSPSPSAEAADTATPTQTVTPSRTATDTPSATPAATAEAPSPTPGIQGTVIVDRANVRGGPGPEFQVMGVVSRDERLIVIGRSRNSAWLQICCLNGQSGWVFGELLSVAAEMETIPIVPEVGTPSATH